MNPALEIINVTKSYPGKEHPAVYDATLTLYKGKTLGLIGESGCGKTTLLRIIAGFEIPEKGEVKVDGRTVISDDITVAPSDRNVGMIFQDLALFPHLSVRDNILFGVTDKTPAERNLITERMLELTNLVGLDKRLPGALSGGQQQRLALARCMATSPQLVLLDEPFSNLDVALKQQVRGQVGDLLKAAQTSAVLVTHDIDDAVSLCDTVAVMKEGRVLQAACFEVLYDQPADEYVARLTGPVADLTAPLIGGRRDNGSSERFLIRPEKIHFRGANPRLRTRVLKRHFAGDSFEYTLKANDVEFKLRTSELLQEGSEVNLFFEERDLFVFGKEGRELKQQVIA
ncbi:MAG: ABC transporter ATP-binding protein [Flavobacteriales bacterium]|nr:ABC transporter ATP-binding protein [Flavobacteriales bacterium]